MCRSVAKRLSAIFRFRCSCVFANMAMRLFTIKMITIKASPTRPEVPTVIKSTTVPQMTEATAFGNKAVSFKFSNV